MDAAAAASDSRNFGFTVYPEVVIAYVSDRWLRQDYACLQSGVESCFSAAMPGGSPGGGCLS